MKQHSQWLYFARDLRVYADNTVYMLKPLEQIQWTSRQAILDAGEVIAETLGQQIKLMADTPDIRAAYAMALRFHAHELIAMGYKRMDSSMYVKWEEPAITGELVRVMRELIESDDAPDWAVYDSIGDDRPSNVAGRLGKSRPRVDIEFEKPACVVFGLACVSRPSALEQPPDTQLPPILAQYGMGCFISGKYPLTDGEAGMLGYLQNWQ